MILVGGRGRESILFTHNTKYLKTMKQEFKEAATYQTAENIYQSFEEFIFSTDRKILAKLAAKVEILKMTSNIPGDIVECGVFRGSGMSAWLKLRDICLPGTFKKVVGFDFFDTESLVSKLSGNDKIQMSKFFKDRNECHDEGSTNYISNLIESAGFKSSDYELIQGDISETAPEYVNQNPGFRLSVLYIDLDLDQPTYSALRAFWHRLSVGGIVVFDEYGYRQWSEANGVDRFLKEINYKHPLREMRYPCPTAYIIKDQW